MPPARTARRPVNDENAENVGTTRLTRAKAAALDSVPVGDPPKKVLTSKRTNSTTNAVLGTRKRTALGDVSNVAKAQEPTDAKKDTLGKGTLSKSAKPVGIQKQPTRAGSTRGVLNARPPTTTATELKKRASSNTNGHIAKKRVAASETKPVIDDENAGDYDDENDFAENVAPPKAKVADQGVTHGKTLKDAITPQRSINVKIDPEFEDDDEVPYEEIIKDAKDLDAEDLDDPLMVAEYVHEIFDYMKELEISTMPNHNYMDNQNELEWKMRGILVDWLLEVHTRFRLLPETLFLAVNIIDRFLSSKVVQLERLQLVGVTAMFIASKYEEVLSPHVQNFVHVADDGFKDTEILSAERFILTTLDYDLSYPNPMNFLRRISKADNYDIQTRTLGKYLLEIGCLDHRFLQYAPSHVAAASMYLSRLALDRGEWDATLTKYAGYTEAEIQPVFKLMVEYLSSPVVHEAFFRKYASKKFLKASIVLRQWAKKWAPKYLDDASLLSSSGKTPRS